MIKIFLLKLYELVLICSFLKFWVHSLQKNAHVVTIDGYEDVPQNDEKALKKAVANQPISVAIEAGGRAFQLYQSVMILNLKCIFSCTLLIN